MKGITSLAAFLIITAAVRGQNYEPQILILPPGETTYDKKFEKDLVEINDQIMHSPGPTEVDAYVKTPEFNAKPKNIQLMTLSELAFSKNRDFFRQVSYFAFQYLTYRFYEKFTNLLVILGDDKTKGGLHDLKTIAENENIQYVLNFPRIELYRAKGIAYSRIHVQLYDNLTNQYLIDGKFEGDWRNPGFEFACHDKTIQCTINNALSAALSEVIEVITANSPTIKRERQLSQQRYDELVANHLSKPYSVEPLKKIIKEDSSEFPLDNIFQVLYDQSATKFLAFSVQRVAAQDFKTLIKNKTDNHVNIISGKDIKDSGLLNEIPRIYAFIIKGVNYEGKWYCEKAEATYFEAASLDEARRKYFNNLQEWGFFIENTAFVNPNFWESGLFEKVRDLRLDPDWEKYGESMWKTEEVNNRPYVGMYDIVANVMRREKRHENEEFEKETKETRLKPAYELFKRTNPKQCSEYADGPLIYPRDRSVIINPVMFTNDKGIKIIRSFVVLRDTSDLFEWVYFQPVEVKSDASFGDTLVDRMNTITDWNFGYDNLQDRDFWEKYVLLKEDNGFKYLRKMQ